MTNMDRLIIILAVALVLGGFTGGMWFWQEMAESPIWEQIRILTKIIGLGGASVLFLFAFGIFFVWKMETQPPRFFRRCISLINIGSWSLFFYMLGCDASILRPETGEMDVPLRKEKTTLKFHIKWDLLKKELFACIIAIAPAVVLLLLSSIDIKVFGMWVAGMVGFAMGFFFWEHLKETGVLTSTFKRLFLLTTVVIGSIAGCGVYVVFLAGNLESIQMFLVSFMLFIWCMAWYMVGLCVVAFRAKYGKAALSGRG
jgi:hypothetical protein